MDKKNWLNYWNEKNIWLESDLLKRNTEIFYDAWTLNYRVERNHCHHAREKITSFRTNHKTLDLEKVVKKYEKIKVWTKNCPRGKSPWPTKTCLPEIRLGSSIEEVELSTLFGDGKQLFPETKHPDQRKLVNPNSGSAVR